MLQAREDSLGHSWFACSWLGIGLALGACAPRTSVTPADHLSFAFEARPTWGEVRVVPTLALHGPVSVNYDSYLGRSLPLHRQQIRRERTRELAQVPAALGRALPGEVNARLGRTWSGQFRGHDLAAPARDRVRDALVGERPDLHASLAHAAREVGGQATLFCWVRGLEAEPLSLRGFPGEVVETELGPVVLDHQDEPYLVRAEVGMALVTQDGEVVLRYQDTYPALLSARADAQSAARELARSLAEEVSLVWAVDPRLGGPGERLGGRGRRRLLPPTAVAAPSGPPATSPSTGSSDRDRR